MNRIFDTHAHYTDARFNDYPGGADALIEEMMSAGGVGTILNVSVDTKNSLEVVAQCQRHAGMYAAVGVHPTEIANECSLSSALSTLKTMLDNRDKNRIVAVGEIGLDYHWTDTDRPAQLEYFEAQLELATEYGLPVIIHDRDAHGDVFEAVQRHPSARGVFHSFSGSAEMARDLCFRGWYISFSGVVTFKNAPRVRQVASSVPLDRLLLETDAPYLAPEPYRGRMNRSDYIASTAASLGELFGIGADEIVGVCRANAEKLFLRV